MSKENVRRFFTALSKESFLQRKFGELNARLNERFKDAPLDEDVFEKIFREELLPALQETGFVFSFQDLKEYAEESVRSEELGDDEMSAVAAGVCYTSLGDTECVGIGLMSSHCPCVMGGSGTR